MASVAFHNFNQFRAEGKVKLFEGSHGYGNGEQQRDFVFVGDVAKVNLFFLDHPEKSGIYNLGSGRAQSFNDVAVATVNGCRSLKGEAALSLISCGSRACSNTFPSRGPERQVPGFTQGDLGKLREAGYTAPMASVEEGVAQYVQWLSRNV